jgi:diphthine-ammonia ligase
MGLKPHAHLGKTLTEMQPQLRHLNWYIFVLDIDGVLFFRHLTFPSYEVVNYLLFIPYGSMYGINVCGEGGEYETLTLDCPLFKASFKYVLFPLRYAFSNRS